MRASVLSLSLLLTMVVALPAFAQAPPPPPEPPDEMMEGERGPRPEEVAEMIEVALQNNPEVRLAAIELERAQVELMQARNRVVRELSQLLQARERLPHEVEMAQQQVERAREAVENGTADEGELAEAARMLMELHGEAEALEGEIQYLMGVGPGFEPRDPEHEREMEHRPESPGRQEPVRTPRPEIPERYRDVMAQSSVLEAQDTPLGEVLATLSDVYDINIAVGHFADWPVTVSIKDTPLGDALAALSETSGGEFCFVFRDYGLLVAEMDRACTIPGATIPAYVPFFGPPASHNAP
ncbi:MAG: hypothetical protein GWP08_03810 [Nitrospiraceae bacterium]|nr:hypothetical protein [Nitrospiraceae bacterium]